MERCPCKQKSPEYPKCCRRASNHCDPEQMHPAHCCIVKLQNEHYCNSSASEHRQSHHSLELPELWQTLIDTLTAPIGLLKLSPLLEAAVAERMDNMWWEGRMVMCSLGSAHSS